MAKTMRSVDTRFWADGWVRKLTPLERYVFLYFLTNNHCNWCGVYELDLETISHETSIPARALQKDIFPKLKNKIIFIDGWVCVKNFKTYHFNKSPNVVKGWDAAWATVPDRVKHEIDRLKTVASSASSSSFTSSSASSGGNTASKEAGGMGKHLAKFKERQGL